MYLKIIGFIFVVLIVSFLQVSFVASLPLYFNGLNLMLVYLLFSLLIYEFEITVYLAAGLGLVMDIYSFSFIGSYIACLIIGVAMINFLQKNFLTNRSLYSLLALFSIFYIYFRLYFIVIDNVLTTLKKVTPNIIFSNSYFTHEASLLLANLALVAVAFYILNLTSKSLKPTFLQR